MKKSKQNYLDFIPKRNPEFAWKEKENGRIEVAVPNTGVYNKIAQAVFKRPKISYIELDEFGSFVWKQIDGSATILEISGKVKEQFGKKAEPLLERLSVFVKTLENHKFVVF